MERIGSWPSEQIELKGKPCAWLRNRQHEAWTVEPSSPYAEPEGERVRRAWIVFEWGGAEKAPRFLLDDVGLGNGWSTYWHPVSYKPARKWSREAKSRERVRRLEKRLEAFPLFADELKDRELQESPKYYAALTNAKGE